MGWGTEGPLATPPTPTPHLLSGEPEKTARPSRVLLMSRRVLPPLPRRPLRDPGSAAWQLALSRTCLCGLSLLDLASPSRCPPCPSLKQGRQWERRVCSLGRMPALDPQGEEAFCLSQAP